MEEVFPGVFMIQRTQGSNVFYVDGDTTAIIDAGFPMDCRRILRQISGRGMRWPEMMIATHYHLDHMGAMAGLLSVSPSVVAAHSEDSGYIRGEKPGEMYKVRPSRAIYYRALAPLFRYAPVEVERELEDGDLLDVMGGLRVIHVPGHTGGSIALFQREKKVLFTGDTIRNERDVLDGPPPAFSPCVEESYWYVRERILGLDFETLLPGHGLPIGRGGRRAVELMMRRQGRLE